MKKLFPALAIVLMTSSGFAMPAMAQSMNDDNTDQEDFDATFQLQRLRDAGVSAVSVADGGDNLLRVTVQTADGGQAFEIYDEDTLQLLDNEATGSIGLGGEINQPAAPMSLESLTHDSSNVDNE